MFDLQLRILQSLHQEHAAMLAVLERLENLLARNRPDDPPDAADGAVAGLLGDVAAALGDDISHHYAFEEEHLFPRFAELIDAGVPEMLRQEHNLIRPIAGQLVEMIAAAKQGGFDADGWRDFHALAREVAEREVFHVQKEEMGFLPALDQMLDEDEDGPLQMAYAGMKNA